MDIISMDRMAAQTRSGAALTQCTSVHSVRAGPGGRGRIPGPPPQMRAGMRVRSCNSTGFTRVHVANRQRVKSHPWSKTPSSNRIVVFALGDQIDDGLEC